MLRRELWSSLKDLLSIERCGLAAQQLHSGRRGRLGSEQGETLTSEAIPRKDGITKRE